MRSKAAISDHPIHPALIAFPVAFYTATVIALAIFQATDDLFWFRVGLVANIAGVVMAVVAAIPGAIDLFTAVPAGSPARSTGLRHAALNLVALVLFAIGAILLWSEWRSDAVLAGERPLEATTALVLTAIGLATTMVAGTLGWKLVQTHHVGVDDSVAHTGSTRPLGPMIPLRDTTSRPHRAAR